MKKNVSICTVLALALAAIMFTACPSSGPSPDTTPPTVKTVTPSGNGVAVAGNVVITFNEAMNTEPGTVELTNPTLPGVVLPGGTWSSDKKVLTKPYSGLSTSTVYTIKISGFKDVAGNVMADNSNNKFTTGTTSDTTPPTVASITPANGSTGVETTGEVVITFSEIINITGPGTVSINSTEYPGFWSDDKTELTVLYFNLTTGTTYTVTISGFQDTAGNEMEAEFTSSFKTEGVPPTPPKAGLYKKDTWDQIKNGGEDPIVEFDKENADETFTAAIEKAKEDGGRYFLVLDDDVQVTSVFNLNGTSDLAVTLTIIGLDTNRVIFNPRTLHEDSLFTVGTANRLILDNNITLKGSDGNYRSLVTVDDGSFYMYSGSAIKGNTINASDEAKGGGVYVKKGTFSMNGGVISGNRAFCTYEDGKAYGGGVYVDADGSFTMESTSKISENSCGYDSDSFADASGGGVYVKGIFSMYNGQISGNTADYGGGVYVDTNRTFTMNNGKIIGNKALGGGGVFMYTNGTFTMKNGEISDNESDFGGGVYMYTNGTFTMEGGEISNNTVTDSDGGGGGGVVVDKGTFTMKNGKISGNKASWGAGGVLVNEEGSFIMEGGEISNNTTTINDSDGGGVYVWTGTFTMKNGKISGNISKRHGGGVYIDRTGTFTMEGGEILSNYAVRCGGGVYLDKGTFTMKGGKIYGNDAVGKANTTLTGTLLGTGTAFWKEPTGTTAKYAAPLPVGDIPAFCDTTIPNL